jgi:DNA-binding NtrC family response regulator
MLDRAPDRIPGGTPDRAPDRTHDRTPDRASERTRDGTRREVELLLVATDPDLREWVRAGLEGIAHRVVLRDRLPVAGEERSAGGNRAVPTGSPGKERSADTRPASAKEPAAAHDSDLALVDEDDEPDFPARLGALKALMPRCQILLVGRENSNLSPRQLGPSIVRHWFFRPVQTEEVIRTLQAAGHSIERARRDQQRQSLAHTGLEEFLGESPPLLDVLAMARRAASSRGTTVLIMGETGTGKGLLARAIHGESPRSSGPFVDINCAAIPSELLESELFGHVKGAFTSAVKDKPGLLELAEGGTVFLDEVGELAPLLQAKILKFLDDGVIRRVQGTSSVKVDVRMIAATNRDLDQEVKDGRFRLDLYHRLGVMVLRLPPLRERPGDVAILARHFLQQLSRCHRRRLMEWSPEALASLAAYSWPGNVRELINLTERLVLLSDGLRPLGVEDLPSGMLPKAPVLHLPDAAAAPVIEFPPEGIALEAVERAILEAALARAGGNVTRAAALLHIGRGSLRYRLEKFGMGDKASGRRGRPMGRRNRAA